MLHNNIGRLRLLGMLEGISYLMLFGITMPLKYGLEMRWPNMVVGFLHGILFMAYLIWIYVVASEHKQSFRFMFWAFIAGLVPFGTFVADKKLFKPLVG